VADAEAVFVGGGNSFRLLRILTTLGVLEALRQAAGAGVPYLAASAGTNLACPTIRTTNDMPIVEPGSLAALGLVPSRSTPTTSILIRAVLTRERHARQGSRSSWRKTTSRFWACAKARGCGSLARGRTCRAATLAACSAAIPIPSMSRSARISPTCSRLAPVSTSAPQSSWQACHALVTRAGQYRPPRPSWPGLARPNSLAQPSAGCRRRRPG
jgi:hypothetical protein